MIYTKNTGYIPLCYIYFIYCSNDSDGQLAKDTEPSPVFLGIDRMLERGVTKKMAQKIVNTGYAVAQSGGKVLYFNKTGVVVLTAAGEIVTTYSAKDFDVVMQAIIKVFYK